MLVDHLPKNRPRRHVRLEGGEEWIINKANSAAGRSVALGLATGSGAASTCPSPSMNGAWGSLLRVIVWKCGWGVSACGFTFRYLVADPARKLLDALMALPIYGTRLARYRRCLRLIREFERTTAAASFDRGVMTGCPWCDTEERSEEK